MHTARGIEVLHVVMPGRGEVTQVRRDFADFVNQLHAERHARLMRDGGEMQRGVGRTAQRHIHRQSVPDGFSVRISFTQRLFFNNASTSSPARLAMRMRWEYTAGTVPLPGNANPSASVRQFIEFAVNIPEQEPQVGQADSSMRLVPPRQCADFECAYGLEHAVEVKVALTVVE